MSLKILGGSLRGRLLQSPHGSQTRPTTSLLRKAVFDILQNQIDDVRFLDLFAGSGAMGLEALSRGAKHASFVENHKATLHCLTQNINALKLENQSTVYSYDVLEALKKMEKKGEVFQIVYADPPYHIKTIYEELLTFLDASLILAPGSILFLESPLPSPLKKARLLHLVPIDERRFGTSLLHQYHYAR
jgi:16S rRNA (guanine966-N2)-methyltransferase